MKDEACIHLRQAAFAAKLRRARGSGVTGRQEGCVESIKDGDFIGVVPIGARHLANGRVSDLGKGEWCLRGEEEEG